MPDNYIFRNSILHKMVNPRIICNQALSPSTARKVESNLEAFVECFYRITQPITLARPFSSDAVRELELFFLRESAHDIEKFLKYSSNLINDVLNYPFSMFLCDSPKTLKEINCLRSFAETVRCDSTFEISVEFVNNMLSNFTAHIRRLSKMYFKDVHDYFDRDYCYYCDEYHDCIFL